MAATEVSVIPEPNTSESILNPLKKHVVEFIKPDYVIESLNDVSCFLNEKFLKNHEVAEFY